MAAAAVAVGACCSWLAVAAATAGAGADGSSLEEDAGAAVSSVEAAAAAGASDAAGTGEVAFSAAAGAGAGEAVGEDIWERVVRSRHQFKYGSTRSILLFAHLVCILCAGSGFDVRTLKGGEEQSAVVSTKRSANKVSALACHILDSHLSAHTHLPGYLVSFLVCVSVFCSLVPASVSLPLAVKFDLGAEGEEMGWAL